MTTPWALPKPTCFLKKSKAKTFVQPHVHAVVRRVQRVKPLRGIRGRAPNVLTKTNLGLCPNPLAF